MQLDTLRKLEICIRKKIPAAEQINYRIPSLWTAPAEKPKTIRVNPFRFWKKQIRNILQKPRFDKRCEIQGRDAIVYNMSPKITTAFDHNGNGIIDSPTNAEGLRESGSFVKSIALLPYLKYMGINTVFLLSGQNETNFSLLNESLAEPSIGFGAKKEFRAFVEALHCMGMKMVLGFMFADTSVSGRQKTVQFLYDCREKFDIDGAMLAGQLTSSFKRNVIETVRRENPDFFFWDDCCKINEGSLIDGYDAVLGNLCFIQKDVQLHRNFLRSLSVQGASPPFFATPENHNTPRIASHAAGIRFAKLCWAINNFLPALPFIHGGFELGETIAVNPTGRCRYHWERSQSLLPWIHNISQIRKHYHKLVCTNALRSYNYVESKSSDIVVFSRSNIEQNPVLYVAANLNCFQRRQLTIYLKTRKRKVKDLVSSRMVPVNQGKISLVLSGGGCSVLALD